MMPQYETKPFRENGKYLIASYAEGFKRCRRCELLIKVDGWRCPYCRRVLTIRTLKTSTAKIAAKVRAFVKVERRCAECGSAETYQRTNATGCTIPEWHRIGGRYHCARCYARLRK